MKLLNDRLIEVGTSKLAKEKGFPQNHAVINAGLEWIDNDYEKSFRCTQTMLQKWLREVKQVNVCVMPERFIYDFGKIEYSATIFYGGETKLDNDFETYEQAMEAGLLEALKLTP